MKKILVKVSGVKHAFPLEDFKNGQGNLKSLSKENFKKLRQSILDFGIISPLHVWKPPTGELVLLDGHQRWKTLCELDREGYVIPDIPTVFVEAASEHEAKKKLLALASAHGRLENDGLYEFISENQIMFDDVQKYVACDDEKFYKEHFDNVVPEEKEKKKNKCPKCGEEI